jgi:hypothetical protein
VEKPTQFFTDEYIEQCRALTPDQIVNFLEQFRQVAYAGKKSTSTLISLKVPEDLLAIFKTKAGLERRPYQAVIKDLMREWVINS